MSAKVLVGTKINLSFNPNKEYRVSEPSLMSLLELLQDAPGLMEELTKSTAKEEDAVASIVALLHSPKFKTTLFKFIAAVLNCNANEVQECRASDLLKILKVLKEEVDWEDLKETFFQIVPKESLSKKLPALANAAGISG